MASGFIPVTSIPGWPSPAAGVMESLAATGVAPVISPDGLHANDVAASQAFLDSYVGSATELQWNKDQKQAALDINLNNNFNLVAFIRAGTATPVTGTQVGNFLATITSNYRNLRAQIAAATTVAQVNAINVNSGWPSNP